MAANTMDAIRKKMQTMRVEKEAARDRAEQFEHELLLQTKLNEQVIFPYLLTYFTSIYLRALTEANLQ